MGKCFSITALLDRRLKKSFSRAGLKSTTNDLGDGTVITCWVPKSHDPTKLTLLLIHGIGANAMWQFYEFISTLCSKFNVYVPNLVFFGDSYTTRPDRTEAFLAECVMRVIERYGLERMHVVGLSYGGYVAYSFAAQFPNMVDRLVILAAGVSMEETDLDAGLFKFKSVDESIEILLPQKPQKVRELVHLSFYKPPKFLPTFFLKDFIQVMWTEYRQERKELVYALYKDRKLSELPKITQPTLIIWGEHDHVFPLELAHRLKRHLGKNAQLVIIKNAGHAINAEKPKELLQHLKSYLFDPLPPQLDSDGTNPNAA